MWSHIRDWVFGFVHVNVHIFLYTIPHAVYSAAVDLPLRLLSRQGGGSISSNLQITVITDPQRLETVDLFGVPRSACSNAAEQGTSSSGAASASSQPLTYDGPCYNAHVHTVMSAFRPVPASLVATREMIHSYDDCRVCLDWIFPDTDAGQEREEDRVRSESSMLFAAMERRHRAPSAVVLILPGLTGSWSSIYVRRLAYFISRENMAAVVLTARGCGDTPLDQPRIFSAVHTDDLRHVLAHELNAEGLAKRFEHTPQSASTSTNHSVSESGGSSSSIPVIAIGFSLGGVILSNYAGEQGKRNLPSGLAAAYSITSPHNLCAADRNMSRTLQSYTYGRELASDLRSYVTRHAHVVQHLSGVPNPQRLLEPFTKKAKRSSSAQSQPAAESAVKIAAASEMDGEATSVSSRLSSVSSVRDYDNLITAPHFGFDSADAYYEAADNFTALSHSNTPQLCLVAADDPICGVPEPHSRWIDLTREHRGGLIYVELPTGGHLGFLNHPLDELRGKANPVERFIVTSVRAVVEHSHT